MSCKLDYEYIEIKLIFKRKSMLNTTLKTPKHSLFELLEIIYHEFIEVKLNLQKIIIFKTKFDNYKTFSIQVA
jgi:hypothetical protein